MDVLRVTGRRRLAGLVTAAGAKNAALPIMAASLLTSGSVRLWRVPQVSDVDIMALLLGHLGIAAKRQLDGSLALQMADQGATRAPGRLARRMRASICVLGPLLARRGRGVVPLPGGCAIGPRPIDLHLRGLAALGADITLRSGRVVAQARKGLRGAEILLQGRHGSSVTATAQVLMAATLARGTTVIRHAAREPEIANLCGFLRMLGAQIEGDDSDVLRVRGVEALGGGSWRMPGDRIEAGTYLLAGAMTQGEVTVRGVAPAHLAALCELLSRAGASVTCAPDAITVAARQRLRGIDAHAEPYPGLATDLQPLWTAVLTTARGGGHVGDAVFGQRFGYLAGLRRFGACVVQQCGTAVVRGTERLHAARAKAGDLRGGAALVLAALAAEGVSTLSGLSHLDRGYEELAGKLAALGAGVERVRMPSAVPDASAKIASNRGA